MFSMFVCCKTSMLFTLILLGAILLASKVELQSPDIWSSEKYMPSGLAYWLAVERPHFNYNMIN